MPGSKRMPSRSHESVLDEPWTNPTGNENEIKRMHRELLPPGYPDDLSRDSQPDTGSIGDKSMPITNKPSPFKGSR